MPTLVSPPSQRSRVLDALRRTRRGITAHDFTAPATLDGGAPIAHLSSVIAELRADGHEIAARRLKVGRSRVTRYQLVREARRPPCSPHDADLAGA